MNAREGFSSKTRAPGPVPGGHGSSESGAKADPRHRGGGKNLLKTVVALILLAAALAPPASAQDRSSLTGALDQFAALHFDLMQPRSIRDRVEYCGLFGIDRAGTLAATLAEPGEVDSCSPGSAPDGFEALASWHTHGAYDRDADTEVPSFDDLSSDIEEGIDGYIATPGGRLWFNDADARVSVLLCVVGCVVADPAYRPCPAFAPGTRHTLDSLRARAENDTGEC